MWACTCTHKRQTGTTIVVTLHQQLQHTITAWPYQTAQVQLQNCTQKLPKKLWMSLHPGIWLTWPVEKKLLISIPNYIIVFNALKSCDVNPLFSLFRWPNTKRPKISTIEHARKRMPVRTRVYLNHVLCNSDIFSNRQTLLPYLMIKKLILF